MKAKYICTLPVVVVVEDNGAEGKELEELIICKAADEYKKIHGIEVKPCDIVITGFA